MIFPYIRVILCINGGYYEIYLALLIGNGGSMLQHKLDLTIYFFL